MKKFLYFFPAIAFPLFLLWISVIIGLNLTGSALFFELSLLSAGFLLGRQSVFGSLFGMIPALYLVRAGQDSTTGLESPIGFFLLFYYLLCAFLVWKSKEHG